MSKENRSVSRNTVIAALKNIHSDALKADVITAGIVSSIIIKENSVGFALEYDPALLKKDEAEELRAACEEAVCTLPGVQNATVVLTTHNKMQENIEVRATPSPKAGTVPPTPKPVAGIKHIIAVASGKGGVGKSMVATNLAVALAQAGWKTGLIDADILGPSIPTMLGVTGEPDITHNLIIPKENHGVKCLSMGLLLKEDTPAIWRGPMVTKAVQKLVRGGSWGELDVLVMDLPPGTGDIHLSIAQNFLLSGAVIVATPQQVALLDVKKAISMFDKVNIPILGIVENMSYLEDATGNKQPIFGEGNIEALATAIHKDILATIPLEPRISAGADRGIPITISDPGTKAAQQFAALAQQIIEKYESE